MFQLQIVGPNDGHLYTIIKQWAYIITSIHHLIFKFLMWYQTKIFQELISKKVDEDHTPRVSYNSYLYTFWLHISNVLSEEFHKNTTKNRTENHIQTPCPLQARTKVHIGSKDIATVHYYLAVCRESNWIYIHYFLFNVFTLITSHGLKYYSNLKFIFQWNYG